MGQCLGKHSRVFYYCGNDIEHEVKLGPPRMGIVEYVDFVISSLLKIKKMDSPTQDGEEGLSEMDAVFGKPPRFNYGIIVQSDLPCENTQREVLDLCQVHFPRLKSFSF